MKPRFWLVCLALGVLGSSLIAASLHSRYSSEVLLRDEARLAQQQAERNRALAVRVFVWSIPSGMAFSNVLRGMRIDALTVSRVIEGTTPVYNLARIRAGNRLAVGQSLDGELRNLRYQIDATHELRISTQGAKFRAEIIDIPSMTQLVPVAGEIHESLFDAVADAGEGPELALRLADIFGWDLDFYTDPRRGDTFRVLVEKKTYLNGQPAGYLRILAAEYINAGRIHRAILFHDPGGKPAYYAPDGASLQKAFLRSPLQFSAPVTSHFSRRRFHPILKRYRPHLGTDYAAPVGTPVQAIADGRVVFAGSNGGAGRMIEIQHLNGYETFSLHLSRLLVRPGQRVRQGQRIGLVGASGLATGPHLDFRIRQRGAFRNFETLRFPPSKPVPVRERATFAAACDRWLALLLEEKAGSQAVGKTAGSTSIPSGQ